MRLPPARTIATADLLARSPVLTYSHANLLTMCEHTGDKHVQPAVGQPQGLGRRVHAGQLSKSVSTKYVSSMYVSREHVLC